MKKVEYKVLEIVANVGKRVAYTANSTVSLFYVHQPKVPKKIKEGSINS